MTDKIVTNSNNEETLENFIGGKDRVFTIPYFQRKYKWKRRQLKELIEDIGKTLTGDGVFFGAVITYIVDFDSKPNQVSGRQIGAPIAYEVVDGQQRIASIFLILIAIVKLMFEEGNKKGDESLKEKAKLIWNSFIILPQVLPRPTVKFSPSVEDRDQFGEILGEVSQIIGCSKGFRHGGGKEGNLINQYRKIEKWLKSIEKWFKGKGDDDGGGRIQKIEKLYTGMMSRMTVLNICVQERIACNAIFVRLNDAGIHVTTGELVRNEIFSKVPLVSTEDSEKEIEKTHDNDWQPFYGSFFDGHKKKMTKKEEEEGEWLFENYIYVFALIKDPSLSKGRVFGYLREQWKGKTPEEIIKTLGEYKDIYLDYKKGETTSDMSSKVRKQCKKLIELGVPSTIDSFVIRLLSWHCDNGDDTAKEKETANILILLESFFLRRAYCGEQASGLNRFFNGLWKKCNKQGEGPITHEKVRRYIRDSAMVKIDDKTFKRQIGERPIYYKAKPGIARYVLKELDSESASPIQKLDDFEIEHILPQKPKIESKTGEFSEPKTRKKHLNCLANLLPIDKIPKGSDSKISNQKISNKTYEEKRKLYKKSKFEITREFAEKYENWKLDDLQEREKELVKFLLKRWPPHFADE